VNLHRRLVQIIVLLVGVVTFGTGGYALIERWSVFDALYMTVITVASVGFGEIPRELSTAGRAFTMVLIVVGLGSMAYGLSTITAFLVEGDIANIWETQKMERQIASLRDHIIVCGGGQTGRYIARELLQTRTRFIVVEQNATQVETLKKAAPGLLTIVGDATDGDVLAAAKLATAAGLITCMPSDKDNLFTILTARDLNSSIRIVSRVIAEESRPKLLRAGADAIVSIPTIGALRLASEAIRPHVVSVLDAMLRETESVRVQEILVGEAGAGHTLDDLRLNERAGITVFAVRRVATRTHHFNPRADTVLETGDVLIACADPDQLRIAQQLVSAG
jgi:voltage-gated potassium channel